MSPSGEAIQQKKTCGREQIGKCEMNGIHKKEIAYMKDMSPVGAKHWSQEICKPCQSGIQVSWEYGK